jgi:uncharacterized protein
MTPGGLGAAWLVGAGMLGGAVGTAGGITSLVSYPALIATGLNPLHANVANLVAALACWPGSALASRRELSGTGSRLRVALLVAAVGGAAGAAAFVTTPARTFTAVAPYLVLLGSVIVLIQPLLTRRLPPHDATRSHGATLPAIGAVSIYGGYFGAGSGILLLATTLTLVDPRLPHANAVKNMLLGAGALTTAAVFVLTASVAWSAVLPLAAGLFLGSTMGPALTRRLPGWLVRLGSALVGLALTADLLRG